MGTALQVLVFSAVAGLGLYFAFVAQGLRARLRRLERGLEALENIILR